MRISKAKYAFLIFLLSVAGLCQPALAFDVNRATVAPTALEAFQLGREALRSGDHSVASTALEYAAEQGHVLSQWKLAKMYANGDGVAQDLAKAHQYFSTIANHYADVPPGSHIARVVSNSFVHLGKFHLNGIAEVNLPSNIGRGMRLLVHAGSYFGDADAQYQLGIVYAEGVKGLSVNTRKAVRWLRLAARNHHALAQAYLGRMLVNGQGLMRRQSEGLMWLEIANHRHGHNSLVATIYHEVHQSLTQSEEIALAQSMAADWIAQNPIQ